MNKLKLIVFFAVYIYAAKFAFCQKNSFSDSTTFLHVKNNILGAKNSGILDLTARNKIDKVLKNQLLINGQIRYFKKGDILHQISKSGPLQIEINNSIYWLNCVGFEYYTTIKSSYPKKQILNKYFYILPGTWTATNYKSLDYYNRIKKTYLSKSGDFNLKKWYETEKSKLLTRKAIYKYRNKHKIFIVWIDERRKIARFIDFEGFNRYINISDLYF